MRRRDQRGASLIIVLALTTLLLLLVPALLGLAFTGSTLAPQVVRVDRAEQYAVTSALDAAILQAQQADWIGRPEDHGGECPTHTVEVGGSSLDVTCNPRSVFCEDRTITFQVLEAGEHQASATVLFAHREGGPVTEILAWSSNPSSPVAPPAMIECPQSDPHEDIAVVSLWGSKSPEMVTGQWRAQAELTLTGDLTGDPLSGAEVDLRVDYRRNGTWVQDATLTGTTNAQGKWQVQSASYPTGGSDPVERVRFTIVDVISGELGWAFDSARDVVEVAPLSVTTRASLAPLTRGSSGNQWTASGVVAVRDNAGDPVAGATVTLKVRFHTDKDGWQDGMSLISAQTSASGTVTVSRAFKDNGKQEERVDEVEYLIETVDSPERSWANSTWPGGELLRSITR